MKTRDIFIALIVPILLGFGFVIAKPAMEYFPPFLLMGLRFTIPALILVWWFPLPKGLLLDIFKVSFIGSSLQYALTYSGLNLIDASSAVLLVQLETPFGILIAYFLLKKEELDFFNPLSRDSLFFFVKSFVKIDFFTSKTGSFLTSCSFLTSGSFLSSGTFLSIKGLFISFFLLIPKTFLKKLIIKILSQIYENKKSH